MTQTASNPSSNIVQALNEGKTAFTYKTKAGETRNAIGTLNADLIPSDKRADTIQSGDTVTYYDLNVNDWRQFKLENLDTSSITAA